MGLPFENADYNEDEVGARKIPELTDVVLTNIQNDNVLVYNNGIWENQAQSSSITEISDIPGVTITNVQDNQFLKYISGVWVNSTDTDNDTDNLNDLTDTLLTTPFGDDEVLKYSGGKWKNGNIPIEKLSNVHISNLQDGETLRYVHQNTRWENAYNIDTLNELTDVTISSNLNNHVLKYNNTDGVYKNAYLNVTDLGDTNITTLANGNTLIYNNGEWSAGNITYTETDPVFTQSPAGSILDGTGFLKNNGGTWSYDTNTYLTSYTETDPVFTISPAGSITNGNGFLKNNGSGTWSYETNVVVATASRVGTWDTAYGWGDHAAQTYLTSYTETDPVFTISPAGSITNGNGFLKNNGSGTWSYETNVVVATASRVGTWDTAYGWGDHAAQTYIKNIAPLYVDSTNNRVGINVALPGVEFEVGNTFNINDTSGRVGILNTNPTTTFQVGYTLNTNLTTERVGIGIVSPAEKLDVDSVIQITGQTATRASLYFSKVIAPEVKQDLAEITSQSSGTNGGDIEFWTADSGTRTKKITINEKGAIGIGATPDYGTTGQFLRTGTATSPPIWKSLTLGGLDDVFINLAPGATQPVNGEFIAWRANTGRWENTSVLSGYTTSTNVFNITGQLAINGSIGSNGYVLFSGAGASSPNWSNNLNSFLFTNCNLIGTKPLLCDGQAGANGDILTSRGPANTPHWVTPSAGGTYTAGSNMTLSASNEFNIPQSVATSDSPSFNQLTLGSVGNNSGIINLKDTTNLGVETIAQMKGILNVTNGGQLEFQTKVNGGILTKKMVISENGKTEFFTDTGTISILSADGTSQQSFIYNSTNGTRDLTIDCYSAVTNKGISFQTGGVRRMRITNTGEFLFGASNSAGSTNDVLTSSGGVGPPYWAPIPASGNTFTNLTATGTIFANTIDRIGNENIQRLGNINSAHITIEHNHPSHAYGSGVAGSWYGGYNGANLFAGHSSFRARNNQCQASHNLTITSDDRFKSRTVNLPDNCLDIINKLQPKKYLKHHGHYVPEGVEDSDLSGVDTKDEAGLISQDVEKIPELNWLITEQELGIDTKKYYKAIDYGSLYPYLIKAVQELNECVKTLEAKVKTLESK